MSIETPTGGGAGGSEGESSSPEAQPLPPGALQGPLCWGSTCISPLLCCRAQCCEGPQALFGSAEFLQGEERKHSEAPWGRRRGRKGSPLVEESCVVLRVLRWSSWPHGHFLQGAVAPHPQSVKKQQRKRTHCWILLGELLGCPKMHCGPRKRT